jgi:hypothetical protein
MPTSTTTPFADALEAADRLSLAEQESLLDILHHRIVERRRDELASDVGEAQAEFDAGGCEPRSARELMDEILG